MADQKLSELDELLTLADDDLFYVVEDATGDSKSCKVATILTEQTINRNYASETVTIDDTAGATVIDMREWAGGSVQPSETHTNVYIYGVLTAGGTGTPEELIDRFGNPMELILSGTSPVPLPEDVYSYPWIALISTVQDTGALLFKKG